MTPTRRFIAACCLAAAPVSALAQTAPLKPDGALRYALGAGGSYVSGTATEARASIGGEGAYATADSRWRFGGRALWSRSEHETVTESVQLMLRAESQHRWRGNTWFRQNIALFPAMHAGESVRGVFDAGLAIAMTPFLSLNVGVTQPYDSGIGLKASDTSFKTGINVTLR